MPSLTNHQSNDYVKLLLCGDSGSGKSGALASLVKAGYHLRILDMDNGLDSLKTFVMKECPDKADNVEFRTLRDDYKVTATGPVVDKPKAFVNAMKMMNKWAYDDIDFGVPAEWGPDVICVIDSLSFLSDAAFDHVKGLNPTAKDPRQWFYSAQQGIESFLAMVTSGSFQTNVIVTAHVRYSQNDDGTTKGYPNAIGSALGPQIPRYFNHWAQCVSKAGKRHIQTAATNMMDLKNTKPFSMKATYPIETGLADFFEVLREPPKVEKPKAITLKRI
jgi:hypothetical protein